MITADQVIPLLLEACPTFQDAWDEHLRENDEPLVCRALGDFARHLLEFHQRGNTDCFPAIASVIERLHIEGDAATREIATIGVLEGILLVWSHSVAPELFAPYLLPESKRWWQSLNDFWAGKSRFVGDGL